MDIRNTDELASNYIPAAFDQRKHYPANYGCKIFKPPELQIMGKYTLQYYNSVRDAAKRRITYLKENLDVFEINLGAGRYGV